MHKLLTMLLPLALLAVFVPGVALAAEMGPGDVMPADKAIGTESLTPDEVLPEQDELLDMYLEKQANGTATQAVEASSSKKWAARKTKLSGHDLIIYTELAKAISEIAAGQRDTAVVSIPADKFMDRMMYTAEDLGVEEITSKVVSDFRHNYVADTQRILSSLLADLPYEFYWFDKSGGLITQINGFGWNSDLVGFYGNDASLEFHFSVSQEYQPSDAGSNTDVDTGKTGAATAAANAAAGIVEENAGLSDLEKVTAYKDKICELTDYNYDAYYNDDTPYGNPWQVIWVFDGDPETKVVCEGYSKAYQFLCDLSSFDSTLTESFLVTGTMNDGPHMWNIMRMPDNRRYLVDVTSIDTGSVDNVNYLFLKGYYSGDAEDKYVFKTSYNDMEYKYFESTLRIYDIKELTLSDKDYDPSVIHQHSMEYHKGTPAKCEEAGIIDTWTCPECEQTFSDPDGKTLVAGDELGIEPLGHAYGAWTRLNDSMHQRVCSHDSKHVEKENHQWNEGVVTKEATANLPGKRLYTCTVCNAERTEVIPAVYGEDIDEITPTDGTAEQAPVDASIQVIKSSKIKTAENISAGQIEVKFPADAAIQNYRIQYRLAGEEDWTSTWSAGTDSCMIGGLKKSSLCEIRIAGYVKQEDLSWACGEWSGSVYRYLNTVTLKSAKAGKKKKTLDVVWAKDKKASGYQVQYSLKKNMSGAKTIKVKGASKTKCTIPKLKSGKKYYVKIRPIKTKAGQTYIGVLSKVKAAKAK